MSTVVALMLLAAMAQAADLLTFVLAIARYGIGVEANPVVVDIYASAGPSGVAIFKALLVLVVLLSSYAIWVAGYHWVAVSVLIFCAVIGFVGAATNLWALSL